MLVNKSVVKGKGASFSATSSNATKVSKFS